MRRGVDTNVLVYAQFPEFPQHERTRDFLLGQLDDPGVTLFLTPTILHEFVHIVTDGRRFEEPLEMATALSTARTFLGRENVTCIAVDQEALLLAYDLLGRHRLGRKRIADCLLARRFHPTRLVRHANARPRRADDCTVGVPAEPMKTNEWNDVEPAGGAISFHWSKIRAAAARGTDDSSNNSPAAGLPSNESSEISPAGEQNADDWNDATAAAAGMTNHSSATSPAAGF